MITVRAYAAQSATTPLEPLSIERRALKPEDVHIDILFSGVCHSDLHQARNEWGGSKYPMVPGHEIVGKVMAIGHAVNKFKVGDTVGVGVMVDSCRQCEPCQNHFENYCDKGMTPTYNGMERDKSMPTQGGYSTQIVTDQRWVFSVSDKLNLAGVAPLLCAGITTYSPLKLAQVKPGHKVAVVGLGGLGHMGVKFAVAMGAVVTMISTSKNKEADAKILGAQHFVLSSDADAMAQLSNTFDVVLDAISGNHDYGYLLKLLKVEGKLLVVGLPVEQPKVNVFDLISKRRMIIGSAIGGTAETQEMLDFCAEKNIVSDIEIINMQEINEAYERMLKNDVKYRFVIDMASLK